MNPLWLNDSKARQSQRIDETARRNTKSIVLVNMIVDPNSGILFDTSPKGERDLLYHLGYTALGGTGVIKRYAPRGRVMTNYTKINTNFFMRQNLKEK